MSKNNVLIIVGDFTAQLGQNNGFKYYFRELTNRNGNMLIYYLLENKLLCLNTYFQKRQGQSWTYIYLQMIYRLYMSTIILS